MIRLFFMTVSRMFCFLLLLFRCYCEYQTPHLSRWCYLFVLLYCTVVCTNVLKGMVKEWIAGTTARHCRKPLLGKKARLQALGTWRSSKCCCCNVFREAMKTEQHRKNDMFSSFSADNLPIVFDAIVSPTHRKMSSIPIRPAALCGVFFKRAARG